MLLYTVKHLSIVTDSYLTDSQLGMFYHAIFGLSAILVATFSVTFAAPEPLPQTSSCLNLNNACELVNASGNGAITPIGTCCEPLTCPGHFSFWPAIIVRQLNMN